MYPWSLHNLTVIVIHDVFPIIQSVIFPTKAPCAAFSIFSDLAPGHGRPTGLMFWITSQKGHLYFVTCWNCIVKPTGDKSDWSFLTTGDISLPSPSGTHTLTHRQLGKCNEVSGEALRSLLFFFCPPLIAPGVLVGLGGEQTGHELFSRFCFPACQISLSTSPQMEEGMAVVKLGFSVLTRSDWTTSLKLKVSKRMRRKQMVNTLPIATDSKPAADFETVINTYDKIRSLDTLRYTEIYAFLVCVGAWRRKKKKNCLCVILSPEGRYMPACF